MTADVDREKSPKAVGLGRVGHVCFASPQGRSAGTTTSDIRDGYTHSTTKARGSTETLRLVRSVRTARPGPLECDADEQLAQLVEVWWVVEVGADRQLALALLALSSLSCVFRAMAHTSPVSGSKAAKKASSRAAT